MAAHMLQLSVHDTVIGIDPKHDRSPSSGGPIALAFDPGPEGTWDRRGLWGREVEFDLWAAVLGSSNASKKRGNSDFSWHKPELSIASRQIAYCLIACDGGASGN